MTMDCDGFATLKSCHLVLFCVLVSALSVSIALNIYCCASKHCSGRKNCKDQTRSQTQRRMEDNPIYGNVALQSSQAEHPFTSSVRRDQRIIDSISQDCYANLSLQMARLDSGPSAPLSTMSPDSEKDLLADVEVLSNISDLYASVQTKAKILQSPDSEEEYANHL